MPKEEQTNAAQNHSWSFPDLLTIFKTKGYEFVLFDELSKEHGQLALRHDIDFDTHLALQMAVIEKEFGIQATYFFLLRSELYNPFSSADHKNILAIKALGHKISVHFDPTLYEDFHAGLELEVKAFSTLFNEKVNIISLHRPNDFFQQFNEPILDIEHTYQSKYFRDIKYFSDSTGIWRFGHPADSEEFAANKTLHVLIHPIWWMVDGENNIEKLRKYFKQRVADLNNQFCLNSIPFRQISDQV